MTLAALSFALGAALVQQLAALPGPAWALALPLLAVLAWKRPKTAWLLAFAAGVAWAALLAHARMAAWLAPELEGRDLRVSGVVSSLPALTERGARFEFEVESADAALPPKLLLSWYRGANAEEDAAPLEAPVHPGERWLFTVRLRRPHGNVNPNGFDYEAWLLERGIGATGYVRDRGERTLLGFRGSVSDYIEDAREAVRERFSALLGATPAAGVLIALAVGEQHAISAEEWRLFNRTGVTHLMSISGLHVTLVSGLLAWLVGSLWRRAPALCLRLPARKAAALAAICGALGYALVAGFAVPAQRTFFMVAVVAAALWTGRVAAPARVLALALAAVVLADPWAPLSPGLWLSFGAVALIFYVAAAWTGREHWLAQWARVQWAVTVGLAPAALLLFGQISLAGPLANALAIPLVSVVVTPLALAAAVLPWDPLLHAAARLVEWLLQFLEWCAALPGALWEQHAPPAWAVAAALAGAAWLLAPRGMPWRVAGLALFAPAFLVEPPRPAPGEAWLTVLDVGQGLAVLVQTANRILLYDAGPAFGADADSGARIVLPAMRAAGLARIDTLVLTHEDADHVGGALTVLESLEVGSILSSLPAEHRLLPLSRHAAACEAGQAWTWDGVRFEMLSPGTAAAAAKRNDLSCVLRVASAGGAALLTGDIERGAEQALVASRRDLKTDVVLVPHHGSRTSSTPAFVAATAPRWAVVPVGYRNRFGHPKAEVAARYEAAGATLLRTDRLGAVRVELAPGGVLLSSERASRPRYWRAPGRV